MNILCIGDIVGRPGREVLGKVLKDLKKEHSVDFTIVNAENASSGSGLIPKNAEEILLYGADVLTMGDHVWDKKEIYPYLNEQPHIIRPANFPDGAPGRGYTIAKARNGTNVGVINLLGRTFMRYNVSCPFRAAEHIAAELRKTTGVIVLDMHAETTSEKVAIGHFIDGKVSIVFGTHTHIQTADERILPNGTAYITDLGMSGPQDSVIGQDKGKIIERFLTSMPQKFEVAEGAATIQGIVVDVDEHTGIARRITRIQRGV
jgi:metallophosphoesterase (TIGR00282 family)